METNEIQKIKRESQLEEQVDGMESRVEDLKTECRITAACDLVDLEALTSQQKFVEGKLSSLKTTNDETEWSETVDNLDHAMDEIEDKDRHIRGRLHH